MRKRITAAVMTALAMGTIGPSMVSPAIAEEIASSPIPIQMDRDEKVNLKTPYLSGPDGIYFTREGNSPPGTDITYQKISGADGKKFISPGNRELFEEWNIAYAKYVDSTIESLGESGIIIDYDTNPVRYWAGERPSTNRSVDGVVNGYRDLLRIGDDLEEKIGKAIKKLSDNMSKKENVNPLAMIQGKTNSSEDKSRGILKGKVEDRGVATVRIHDSMGVNITIIKDIVTAYNDVDSLRGGGFANDVSKKMTLSASSSIKNDAALWQQFMEISSRVPAV